ncbi:Gfo/Idh/MocA family protein [Aquincola tertiaricarbonis]|uniref:Gfo/Idh/MocA family protein n=1 Tax=Aquincola tertiaricarbonis TaxID=391953 RepID=UPI0009FB2333|nr:Gfo/Idh/MocA family oxidoreductase [Aquincola tertiaricarbonis]
MPTPDAASSAPHSPPPARPAGYAVVGLGQLTLEEILPAFALCTHARPVALVSGDRGKALPVAREHGIAEDHVLDYEHFGDLAGLADVDVVYIVLPNHLHAEYTLKAFQAGKHVLCEKPMAVTAEECQRMMDAARAADRQLMIAYRLHHEPFNQRMAALCQEEALGRVKTIMASNCQVTKAPDIRLQAGKGGGPVSDTGIYCINACRMVTGEEPESAVALAHQPKDNPDFAEVPESVAFLLRYPSGVIAHCETSFGAAESRHLRVHCADGFIDMEAAFSYQGQRLQLRRGSPTSGPASTEELLLKPVNHFAAEMDYFAACALANQPPRTDGEMGLADVRIIDAIEQSLREGGVVRLQA